MLISIDGQTFRKANEGVEVIYDDVDVPVYAEPGEVHITLTLSNLFQERSLSISDFGLRSYCTECTPIPFVGVRGHFKDQPFVMTIYLQPLPETEPKEIIDRISHEVRTIKEPDQ